MFWVSILIAAYALPASATTRAIRAIRVPGEGFRRVIDGSYKSSPSRHTRGRTRAARRRSVPVMAKERLKSPRARLFVALDLPDEVRDGIAAWQAQALADEALRPMRPESLHVTLCFLGYHPEKAIPGVAEVVSAVEPRPVELSFDPEPSPIPKG